MTINKKFPGEIELKSIHIPGLISADLDPLCIVLMQTTALRSVPKELKLPILFSAPAPVFYRYFIRDPE